MDHSTAWASAKSSHYNTGLEEILASKGENGEGEIEWDFPRERDRINAVPSADLGTPRIVWEMRIRELEEEVWQRPSQMDLV